MKKEKKLDMLQVEPIARSFKRESECALLRRLILK